MHFKLLYKRKSGFLFYRDTLHGFLFYRDTFFLAKIWRVPILSGHPVYTYMAKHVGLLAFKDSPYQVCSSFHCDHQWLNLNASGQFLARGVPCHWQWLYDDDRPSGLATVLSRKCYAHFGTPQTGGGKSHLHDGTVSLCTPRTDIEPLTRVRRAPLRYPSLQTCPMLEAHPPQQQPSDLKARTGTSRFGMPHRHFCPQGPPTPPSPPHQMTVHAPCSLLHHSCQISAICKIGLRQTMTPRRRRQACRCGGASLVPSQLRKSTHVQSACDLHAMKPSE